MPYLDHASTSYPKDPRVVDAVARALVDPGVSPDRGDSARGRTARRIVEEARRLAADLLSVQTPERISFTLNATDALNLALKGLLNAGDEVVHTQIDHNSVVRPLHGLGQRIGVGLKVAPAGRDGVVRADDVLKLVTPRTRLVVMTHASNVTGALQPVGEVGRALRAAKSKARFLVDVAQSAGYRPLDEVAEVADAIAVAGHKGPGGPLGTGFLWVRPEVDLVPFREGGTGTRSAEPLQPRDDPGAYEAGSPNVPGIAGLAAALKLRLAAGELGRIMESRRAIGGEFLARTASIQGVRVHGPAGAALREPVFAVRVERLAVAEASLLLEKEFEIEQRAGLHCAPGCHLALGTAPDGTLRLSFGAHPSAAEVAAAVDALAELARGAA
jgi:cysteine desulfurase / selenocysteine lyase